MLLEKATVASNQQPVAGTDSPVCSSWQPPPPYQKVGCPCSALDRAGNGNLDQCWRSAAYYSLCSKHQTPCHTGGGKVKKQQMQTNNYMNEVLNICLVCAHKTNRSLYLINVFTVGTISTETSRTWATLPGTIWRTVAIHSPKARVRQTAICKPFRQWEFIQTRDNDLNIVGHFCIVCLQII